MQPAACVRPSEVFGRRILCQSFFFSPRFSTLSSFGYKPTSFQVYERKKRKGCSTCSKSSKSTLRELAELSSKKNQPFSFYVSNHDRAAFCLRSFGANNTVPCFLLWRKVPGVVKSCQRVYVAPENVQNIIKHGDRGLITRARSVC